MCYRAHQASLSPDLAEGASVPASQPRVPPRWAGAALAAVIGSVALAALVAAPLPPRSTSEVQPTAAPVTHDASTLQSAGGTHGSLPVDDGVPTAADVRKAAKGHCDYAL